MSQVLTSYLNRSKIYTPDDAAFYAQYGDWPGNMDNYVVSNLAFDDYETNTLGAAITSTSAASITVGSTIALSTPFYLLVDSEVMLCTAKDGIVLTVTRGAANSTAAAHSSGASVYAYKFVDSHGKTWTPNKTARIVDGQAVFASGDYISVPSHDDFNFSALNFQISMDVTTTSTAANCTLCAKSPTYFQTGMWALQFNYGTSGCLNVFVADYSTGSPLLQASTGVINDGAKHRVIWKRNGTTHQLMVDGVVVATKTASFTISTLSAAIYAAYDQYYGRGFVGKIDNLKIYKGFPTE